MLNVQSVGMEYLAFSDELAPPRFVEIMAAAGADTVCLGSRENWGLQDPALRRETRRTLDQFSIGVSMADGFLVGPQWGGMDSLSRQLDIALEMGAPLVNACALDLDVANPRNPDSVRDALADLCELARGAGVGVLLEFMPLSHIPSLTVAVALLQELAQPNLRVLLDVLHLARAGEGLAELAKVDPAMIGYCQLCDAMPGIKPFDTYLDEALHDRDLPGDGAMPLVEMLRLLPRETVVSAEVPLRRLRKVGLAPTERARLTLEASRKVIAQAWGD